MILKRFVAVFALIVSVVAASAAQAGVYGSALLNITNARVERFDTLTSTWVAALASDLQVTAIGTTAVNDVTLGATNVLIGAAGFDALQAAINPVEAENFMGFHGQFNADYVRADTNGGGILVGGTAAASTVAEAFTVGTLAASLGNTAGTATVRVRVNRAGSYRLAFTADAKMIAESDGSAIGGSEIQFSAQINGGLGNLVNFAPVALNQTLSNGASPALTYTLASTNFASAGASLAQGQLYSFTIQQASIASVTVPEPTSIAVFGLLGVGALVVARRNRKS